MALVLDTGVIFAALVSDEDDHAACRALIEESREQLIIPAPVFVELEYLLCRRATLQAWTSFATDVGRGAYSVYPLDGHGVDAVARLQTRYSDLRLGFVDAAVFVTCESLEESKVATLDHRHFGVLLTQSGRTLQILPERRPVGAPAGA